MPFSLKLMPSVVAVLTTITISACSSSSRQSSLKILNGTPTPPGESLHVVAIATAAGDFFCSGVLVTDRLVLTAAHCLAGHAPYDLNLRVVIGEGNEAHHFDAAQLLPVESGKFASTYKGQPDSDIAYLILKHSIPVDAARHIVPLALDNIEILNFEKPKQKLRLMGFGCRDQQINCKAGIKHQVDILINTVSRWTMDVGTTDQGASNGDSGGPAFAVLADGSQKLMGITSGRGNLGTNYVLIRPHICWISRESNIDIPAATSHCYDQALMHPQNSGDVIGACKNPANTLQTHTFALLKKALGTLDCSQLVEDLKTTESLNLSQGYFFDPTALTFAEHLKHLDLSGHRQTDLLPIATLSSLETLDLDLTLVEANQLKNLRISRPKLRIKTHTADNDLFAGIESANAVVVDLALEQISGLDIRNASGLTPLQRATELKQHESIKKIIERGANVNAITMNHGHTALHLAIFSNDLKSVQLLVDHHADCTIKNKHDDTALDVADRYNRGTELQRYLVAFCKR